MRRNLTRALGFEQSGSTETYFSSSEASGHLDLPAPSLHGIPPVQRQAVLRGLIQSYLSTMTDLGIVTWLAHGTLLGWYWGQKVLPWDTDLDVHIPYGNLTFLTSYYNMTIYRYDSRKYLLDLNSHHAEHNGTLDWDNRIGARSIDTQNGITLILRDLLTSTWT